MQIPTFKIERGLINEGYSAIVGVDEAGCGALAGPLVAAAVILPLNSRLGILRDSKTLTHLQKEKLFDQIKKKSDGFAVGIASVREIYSLGLRPANLLAMRRAIEGVEDVDYALVDAWTVPELSIPQQGIVRGDKSVKSIAAASVIAKVTRDKIMLEIARDFPKYGFEDHKGYATEYHRAQIKKHGPCMYHRLRYKTFQQNLFG